MKKTIEGKTLGGEARKYTFELMDTKTGLYIEHQYLPVVGSIIGRFLMSDMDGVRAQIKALVSPEDTEEIGDITEFEIGPEFLDMIESLPRRLPWPMVADIAEKMLAGGSCVIGTDEHEFDESGMADYFNGDLLEFYTAIFYGVYANYPKGVKAFFEVTGEGDTSQNPARSKNE